MSPTPWDERDGAWSHEAVLERFWAKPAEIWGEIRAHPGYKDHRDIESVEIALAVFRASVDGITSSIEAFFEYQSTSNSVGRRRTLEQYPLELAVQRSVFCAAAAAGALADHSLRINTRHRVDGYQRRLSESIFASAEHPFVVDLRNVSAHQRIVSGEWLIRITFQKPRREQKVFRVRSEDLAPEDNWSGESRRLASLEPDGVDLQLLFERYRRVVDSFYDWYVPALTEACEPGVSAYRSLELLIKREGSRSWWRLVLSQIMGGRDPYDYLDRYLSPDEIEEIESLPHRSRQQVDRIIELVDEYGCCDEKLRALAYQKFGNCEGG